MTRHDRQPMHSLPLPQQAGILCNDPQFQQFAAIRCGLPTEQFNQTAAAEYLRDVCKIESRRHLATTPDAAKAFHALCTEFDAWRGKIPPQR